MHMNDSIRLHPKHGLNPTIPICFYCGKEKNEIALLGAAYRGEAPMHMVTSVEPCDECKERYVEYTLLVEMERVFDNRAYGRKELQQKPTGRWIAIRRECLNVEPTPVAFVDTDTMNDLIKRVETTKEV
jgi:hypothetical protein